MNVQPFLSESVQFHSFEQSDVERLHGILNHQDLVGRRYIPWRFSQDIPLSKKQVGEIIQNWSDEKKGFHMAIFSQSVQDIIGYTSASWGWDPHSPDVSVVIDPPHQRKGLGAETLKLVVNYLVNRTPAHNISTWISEWNQGGCDFALKMGFHNSGRLRRAGIYDGKSFDLFLMDILQPEWLNKHSGDENGA